jgi:hypothetical protein
MMKPVQCIEDKPTRATIMFGGEYINLTVLSIRSNVNRSYISHILASRRDPALSTCTELASALGIPTPDFVCHLEDYWQQHVPPKYQVA